MNERTERLIGKSAAEKIQNSKIALFGVGGVGSGAFEALVRAGVTDIDVFDCDSVSLSNLNRQLIATEKTVDMRKTDAAQKRALEINPDVNIGKFDMFVDEKSLDGIDFSKYDYVIDAIDTVSSKIALVLKAQAQSVPIISCMGTGNKLCPEKFEVSDIYKTSVCPLARVMRRELKARGVKGLKVVYSKEIPVLTEGEEKRIPASISFVPPVAGMIIAAEVIKDIINLPQSKEERKC